MSTQKHSQTDTLSTISFFVAGFASLAFQIVSFKLITASGLGDAISVAISLTGSVSLSGLGALLAARVKRQITAGALELLMGLYALALFGTLFALGIDQVIALFAGTTLSQKLFLFLLATGPLAFLSGMLIPLHQYRQGKFAIDPRREDFGNFVSVYLIFHAGGALSLVLVETMAFPLIGWPLVGALLALLSTLNGFYVMAAGKNICAPQMHKQPNTFIQNTHKLLPWLFLLSVLTGFAGIVSYKMFDFMVTPNIQNYSIVTALIFLAFTFTSLLAKKINLSFRGILSASGLGILCFFIPITAVPILATYILDAGLSHWWIYWLAGGLLLLPAYTLIGLSVPSAVRLGIPSHQALFVVALGNALGYWLYIMTAHFNADAIILLSGAALLLIAGSLRAWLVALPLAGALAYAVAPFYFPATHHMVAAHRLTIMDQHYLEKFSQEDATSNNQRWTFEILKDWNTYGWPIEHLEYKRLTNDVVDFKRTFYFANGYRSLDFTHPGLQELGESFIGGLPMLYVSKFDKALVLGGGPGITAGFVSTYFNGTDLVDLSPDAANILDYYKDLNYNARDKVKIYQQDALSFVGNPDKYNENYDYIISTVSGAANSFSAMVYTKEFFAAASKLLSEDGIYSLWMNDINFKEGGANVYAALKEIFPYVRPMTTFRSHLDPESRSPYSRYHTIAASKRPLSLQANEDDAMVRHLGALDYAYYKNVKDKWPNSPYMLSDLGYTPLNQLIKEREIHKKRAPGSPARIDRLKFAYYYKLYYYEMEKRLKKLREH